MNQERFREELDELLRQYSPLVAGTDDCDELRWELNELLDPDNGGPDGFINELTVHKGRIVVKVYVPDRAERDADEWCAALQEYIDDALVVEPTPPVLAAYGPLPGVTGVLTGSFGTWAVDGFSIDPDDRPELPAFGEKARQFVREALTEHYAAEAKRNPPHLQLTRPRGSKGKAKRW